MNTQAVEQTAGIAGQTAGNTAEVAGQIAGQTAGNTVELAGTVAGQAVSQAAGNTSELATQVAGQVTAQAANIPAFSWSGYIMTVGMLFLLLGGLWLALRLLKKRGGLKIFGVNDALAVESRLSLGPKKNLLIVRTPGKKLLLGVTDHHISKLAELPLEDGDEC